MSDFINTVDIIGDSALTDSIIDRSITEYKDEYVEKIGSSAFYGCVELKNVDLLNVINIGDHAFRECTSLETLVLRNSNVCACGDYYVLYQTPIANDTGYIYVPKALINQYPFTEDSFHTGSTTFTEDTTIEWWMISDNDSFKDIAWVECPSTAPEEVTFSVTYEDGTTGSVTRTQNPAGLVYFPMLPNTDGYASIDIPSGYTLLNKYGDTKSNWYTYRDQFRAIEDYPDICG